MIRYKKSDFEEVGRLHSGTSALFIGINKITGKKGVYKENGALLGITNEDVREKMASDILNAINKECAQIDLVYDQENGKTACFSNYIINEDEELIDLYVVNNKNSDNKVKDFIDSYIECVGNINDDKKFIEQCKKNACERIYMSCILDTYDLKGDNLPIVHNIKTGEYKISPWFDHGTAFVPDAIQKQDFFTTMSSEEVLNNLFSNYYNEIKDIANVVNDKLDRESIDRILFKDYVRETFLTSEVDEIKNRLSSQIQLSNDLLEKYTNRDEYIKVNKISTKIKSFFSKIFRKNDVKLLSEPLNEKNDDKEILDQELTEMVNTTEEIAASQENRENMETKEQEINDIYK